MKEGEKGEEKQEAKAGNWPQSRGKVIRKSSSLQQ
jgi:hypothetical protein